ncbi:MAG: hypothetical protein ACLP1X_04495 [Polyangiaceae bacterium]
MNAAANLTAAVVEFERVASAIARALDHATDARDAALGRERAETGAYPVYA